MRQENTSALPKLVEPKPAEPESTNSAPTPRQVENQITDGLFEIELAPLQNNPLVTIIDSTTPTKLQIEKIEDKISEILKSPEIIYAVVATMLENVAHNDPNTFQNKQALKILEELAKESTNQDPFQDILKLSEFAKDSKKLDRNYSLVADSIRLIAGAIALSSSIYESSKKVDDSEMGRLNSATEISLIISAGTQIIASPITAYNGYQASIVGHFVEELSDAFETVANKLASKLGESKQNCSDPNHKHAKTGQQEGHCDHEHVSHAGSSARHLGTALNVASMGISASSASYRFINFINNKTINNLYTSTSALIAPLFSITGKTSSAKAAEIRKDEIEEKISRSKEGINDTCAKILNGTGGIIISEEAIKSALVVIGKEAEEKTKEERSKSGIKMRAKTLLTYMKDSVYGAPYNAVTYFRHTDEQTQNFETQPDPEQQNRKGTGWDLDLSNIKEKIGAGRLENCNEELTTFLFNKYKSSNLTSSKNKDGGFRSKRAKEPEQESSGFSSLLSSDPFLDPSPNPFSEITTDGIKCTLVLGDTKQVGRL